MSQYQLAEMTGIHRAQIGAWEAERHSPTFDSLSNMAAFFDVDVLRFLAGPTAPEMGVRPSKGLIEVALFDGAKGFLEGRASGAFFISSELSGCVAMRVSESSHGWTRALPEVRPGDIWAVRPGGKPRDGALVFVVPVAGENLDDAIALGVWRKRPQVVDTINPSYPSIASEDVQVVAVAESLVWRDYRKGVRR